MMTEDELFEAELDRTIREQTAMEQKKIEAAKNLEKISADLADESEDVTKEMEAELKAALDKEENITEEQLSDVTKILEDNAANSKEIQKIREITESEQTETLTDEEGVGTTTVDPVTGVTMTVPNESNEEVKEMPISEKSFTELMDEYEPSKLPVLDDQITQHFKNDMDLSDEDAMQLLSVIHRHSAGEKFSKFNALPKKVQDMIRKAGAEVGVTTPDQLRFFTNTMLDEFIQDAAFNKEIVDFEESLKKELNIPSLVDMHSEYIKDAMEKDLLARADKLEKEGKADKADMLRNISAAFTASYTYSELYETLENNRKVRSRLAKDVEKYKKFCDDFAYKYQNTQFNIHDIAICLPILKRKFPHRTENELVMFVNTMWKSMELLPTDELDNNIYAYYLIKNIMSLDFVDDSAKTEFTTTIMNNIENVIDKINDYVIEKAQYDAKIEEERQAKKGGKKNG